MINAAIVGLGWWGKHIVQAVQGKSEKLRFVHGVSKEFDAVLPIAEANGFTLSDDLEKALADRHVQAVVLATPHSLHADQIDAFADAAAGRAPYPITPAEMVNTIAAFEAIIRSMDTGMSVQIGKNRNSIRPRSRRAEPARREQVRK